MIEPSKELTLTQRMLGIMQDIAQVPTRPAKAGMRYSYVSHDDVAKALHPLFVKWGVIAVPAVLQSETEPVTYVTNDDSEKKTFQTVVNVRVTFLNADERAVQGREEIPVLMPGVGLDPMDKGAGKAVSYAIKYALIKTFHLEAGDPDVDEVQTPEQHEQARSAGSGAVSPKQLKYVRDMMDRLGSPAQREEVLKRMGIAKVDETLHFTKAKELIEILKPLTDKRG